MPANGSFYGCNRKRFHCRSQSLAVHCNRYNAGKPKKFITKIENIEGRTSSSSESAFTVSVRMRVSGCATRREVPILTMAFNLDRGEGLADPSAENPVDGGSESLYVNANL